MAIMSIFTHPHVIPNTYDFFISGTQKEKSMFTPSFLVNADIQPPNTTKNTIKVVVKYILGYRLKPYIAFEWR